MNEEIKKRIVFIPSGKNINPTQIIGSDVEVGQGAKIWNFVNIYGKVSIGENTSIGTFVELQDDVTIGRNTRIQSHTFICSGVTIGNNCFIGHGVKFTNDKFTDGTVHSNSEDWQKTLIKDGVMIGSGSIILPVTVGENSVIGAGSVVTKDIPPNVVAYGNPCKVIRKIKTKK